jgi:DNA-binding LytR/AlgR family response regulator
MRYVIIEDEPLAAEKLHRSISNLEGGWELLKIIPSVKMALSELPLLKPDLLFLDVHLSDGNSFQIFDQLKLNVPVIFTTAFDAYALKAFELNSIDYLLKPVTDLDLKKALVKLEQRLPGKSEEVDWRKLILDLKPSYKDRFMVTTGKRIKSLEATDIAFFFAQGKHTFITDKQGKEYLIDKTLSSLNEVVDPRLFFQINRQYIIRISAIQEMITYSKGRLKLHIDPKTPTETIVSTEKASRFKRWLEGDSI